jgi:predicted dehydrogenase
MKPLRFGVVGAGYWGPNIIRNLADMPEALLSAVCDKLPERLEPVRRRYPAARLTSRVEDILSDPAIDAVAIATPISTHYPIAREALLAGKHVFVEKPLAQTGREARALAGLARRKKRTLMVDHVFIYSSPVQMIRRLIRTRQLGELYYFDSVRVNLGLFQKDANVLWDLAPHDLSIMDYLLDQDPQSISATAVKHIRGSGKEDVAYLTIRYPRGLIAHIHVNWLAPAKIRQILIGGAKRMVVYDDTHPSEKVKVYDKGVHLPSDVHRQVQYRLGDMRAPNLDTGEALRGALNHFVQCVSRGARPWSDGAAGVRVVEYLEAASRSILRRGREIAL